MRELIFLSYLLIACACITACSDDDKEEVVPVIAPKSIINTGGGYYGYYYKREFVYKGNKLVQENQEESLMKYFYSGSLLTKIEYYYNGTKTGYMQLEYKEGTLAKIYEYNIYSETASRTDVTYTSNLVRLKTYSGDYYEQDHFENEHELEINGGNITEIRNDWFYTEYSYDTKNNPFVNILGIKELQLIFGPDYGVNNYVSYHSVDVASGYVSAEYEYSYNYNSNNFPTSKTQVDQYGYEASTLEFNY